MTRMANWTSLKKQVEGRFAESVRGRVQLHMARFREGVDDAGKIWMTLDKKPFAEFDHCRSTVVQYSLAWQIHSINHPTSDDSRWYPVSLEADKEAIAIRKKRGLFTWHEFWQAMVRYLSMPADRVFHCEDPMIRAIGFFDRRIGKRRLRQAEFGVGELPLVVGCYEFRCEAEGLPVRRQDA